mgnify:CR=1 FL=1
MDTYDSITAILEFENGCTWTVGDDRTLGMQEEVFKVIPKEEVYNLQEIV